MWWPSRPRSRYSRVRGRSTVERWRDTSAAARRNDADYVLAGTVDVRSNQTPDRPATPPRPHPQVAPDDPRASIARTRRGPMRRGDGAAKATALGRYGGQAHGNTVLQRRRASRDERAPRVNPTCGLRRRSPVAATQARAYGRGTPNVVEVALHVPLRPVDSPGVSRRSSTAWRSAQSPRTMSTGPRPTSPPHGRQCRNITIKESRPRGGGNEAFRAADKGLRSVRTLSRPDAPGDLVLGLAADCLDDVSDVREPEGAFGVDGLVHLAEAGGVGGRSVGGAGEAERGETAMNPVARMRFIDPLLSAGANSPDTDLRPYGFGCTSSKIFLEPLVGARRTNQDPAHVAGIPAMGATTPATNGARAIVGGHRLNRVTHAARRGSAF